MSDQSLYRIICAVLWVPAAALLILVGWGLNWINGNYGIEWMAAATLLIFLVALPIAAWIDIRDGQYSIRELPWAMFRPRRNKDR